MSSPNLRVLAFLMLLLAGTGSRGQQPGVPVKGAVDSEAERANELAYAELDRVLHEREEAIATAARGLRRFIVSRYRDDVLARTIPVLAALRVDAGAAAREGRTRDAAARYQAALVISQLVMMDVNLVIIADYADQSGEPSGEIVSYLNAYERSMAPLLEAAGSLNPERLKAELPEGTRKYSEWMEFANQWTKAIGRGAEISRKTILVLDTVMVVLAVRQVAVLAAKGIPGGGPPMMPMPSGVMAATRLDIAAMERTYEAIRKLIAAGAMDPVVAGGIAAFANAAASPQLTGPVAWSMQGVDPPSAVPVAPPSPKEPGQWTQTNESMSDRAADYQQQQTGRPARIWEYKVGDVSFDGFKDGKLIEAKGPGYAQWLELDKGKLQFRRYFQGARQMADQLRKHSEIAERGVPIEWRVAEPRLAEYLRQYVTDKGFKITVVHVPPK